jgi:flagellar biosynthesis GTPase FlhF
VKNLDLTIGCIDIEGILKVVFSNSSKLDDTKEESRKNADEAREAAKEQARMLNRMMRLLQEAEEKEKEKEGRREERERRFKQEKRELEEMERKIEERERKMEERERERERRERKREKRERQREEREKKRLEALGNLQGKSTTTYLGQLSILNIYPRRNKKGKHSQPIPPPSCINCTIPATAAVTRLGPTLSSNANSMVPTGGPKPATSLACLAAHRVMGAAVNTSAAATGATAGSQFRRYPQRTEHSRIGKERLSVHLGQAVSNQHQVSKMRGSSALEQGIPKMAHEVRVS